MRLAGRVSLEELDAYARSMGFDSWDNYKLNLSNYERKLVFNTIHEEQMGKQCQFQNYKHP